MEFFYRNIKIKSELEGDFTTWGLCLLRDDDHAVHAWLWYTNPIEKIALASPNCTDKTRRMIYRRVIRRAFYYKGLKPDADNI